jgi:branched-chain amino acid transport system ATP-binding protein
MSLPYGLQKLVELGRALVSSPKLVLLDEPVSGMNQEEKDTLTRILLEIRKESMTTILLQPEIVHKTPENIGVFQKIKAHD